MDNPERRVAQLHALDNGILATDEIDELRTQTLALAEYAFLGRHAVVCHLQQVGTRTDSILALPFVNTLVIAVMPVALHVPPTLVRAVAVNDTLTGNADVLSINSIDARLVVDDVESLPAGLHVRIQVAVEGEAQRCTFLDNEVHVALQRDGTSHEHASRHDDLTAALL